MKRRPRRRVALLAALVCLLSVGLSATAPGVQGDVTDVSPAETTDDGTVCVVFFHSPGCPHCANVEAYLEDHAGSVTVRSYRARDHTDLWRRYLREYGVPESKWGAVPTVFVGERYAVGDRQAIELIDEHVQDDTGVACPSAVGAGEAATTAPDGGSGPGDADRRSGEPTTVVGSGLTVLGLVNLGLVDAVNPCALAVLVTLLTGVLSRESGGPGEALRTGLAFVGGVLLAYLSLGVLLVIGLSSVVSATGLDVRWLYRLTGGFALVLGLLNLTDWVDHGSFGFAVEVPTAWRPRMNAVLRRVTGPGGAALAGVVVSLFLLPCTAGPYFVAGGLLAPLGWARALPWLALYNAVFVAPMAVLVLAVGGGLASVDRVARWRERRLEQLHLVAGVLLAGVGVGMLFWPL